MSIDLHLHSTASDGILSPTEVVDTAKTMGLKAIALTDHDTVCGVEEAVHRGNLIGVQVLPGLEINAEDAGDKVHILGYFIDYCNPQLLARLLQLKVEREERIFKTIDKLKNMSIHLNDENMVALTQTETLGRSALARVLINEGYVSDKKAAFDLYIGEGAPAFVPRCKLTPQEAIELISDAGGIAIWAHPGQNITKSQVVRYKQAGLVGLEVFHHTHAENLVHYLQELAHECHLVISGGSDCHGRLIDGKLRMGTINIPDQVLVDMKKVL